MRPDNICENNRQKDIHVIPLTGRRNTEIPLIYRETGIIPLIPPLLYPVNLFKSITTLINNLIHSVFLLRSIIGMIGALISLTSTLIALRIPLKSMISIILLVAVIIPLIKPLIYIVNLFKSIAGNDKVSVISC